MMARPYVAPPGIPPERLNALRAAFDATMKDRVSGGMRSARIWRYGRLGTRGRRAHR